MNKRSYPGLFLLIIAGSVLLLFSNSLKSQDLETSIEKCLSEGDAKSLAAHFGESVDIGLPYADKDYGKTQAEMVMKSFFEKHPPGSFKIEESGSTTETSKFFIGEYISGDDRYTLLIMLRKSDDSYLIHKLKFQEKKPE